MKINLELVGTFCNSWPNLIIEINKNKIYDAVIEGEQNIDIEYNDADLLQEGNTFVVGMNNKKFGENNQWDTKIQNNKIVEDKKIQIKSTKLNGVDCMTLFNNKFYVKTVDKQQSYFPDVVESNGTINYNGYFTFGFDIPLYNSLINKKYKRAVDQGKSYFSNYTKVFHYDEEIEIINSIKRILDKVNEKSSN
jgi:hypothetical protein|tara:strand:- start:54 stop:632 length:579 start_codon:yes stop_codon:yes gene_type:complete